MSGKRARAGEATKDPYADWHATMAPDREKRLADLPPAALDIPPPTLEQWHNFLRNIAYAGAIADAGDPLQASQIGVSAAIDLLETGTRPDVGEKLTKPFWLLLAAMKDVKNGRLPKMFDHKASMTSKPGDSTELIAIRQIAAIAVQELLEAGHKLTEACSIVAHAMGHRSDIWPQHRSKPAETILNWREAQMKPSVRAEYNYRLDAFRKQYASRAGEPGTPAARAEISLETLKAFKS